MEEWPGPSLADPSMAAASSLSPTLAVALELVRAVGSLAALPVSAAAYLARRRRLEAAVRADLGRPATPAPTPELRALPGRRLRVFVSCAEPSGEDHACRFVDALRERVLRAGGSEPAIAGLGGPRLARAGVEIVGDPVSRAAMGFGAARALPFYLGLLRDAARAMRDARTDLFVPIDSPALHVPLGHVARRYGVPVVHFVTPQYWGWAPWRVRGYRSAVDRALTILPFEPAWFERHGVAAAHVGHPLLDALAGVPRRAPIAASGASPPCLVVLPGSRASVIRRNLPWMLDVCGRLREGRELEVVLAHERAEVADLFAEGVAAAGAHEWARVRPGALHDVLARARAAFSVSGTVLLDLLHHRVPSVVLYRLASARETFLARNFLTTPWFSSVNLLADREVLPEFCFHGDGPRAEVAAALERCLDDDGWRAGCLDGLELAAERLGPPGAVERAADQALAVALARQDAGTGVAVVA